MNRSKATSLANRLLIQHGLRTPTPWLCRGRRRLYAGWTAHCDRRANKFFLAAFQTLSITDANNNLIAVADEEGLIEVPVGYCGREGRFILLYPTYVEWATNEEVELTILHEIAHALAPKPGHGREWKRIARKIGATRAE